MDRTSSPHTLPTLPHSEVGGRREATYLGQVAPDELCRPVALHYYALVLHLRLDHHKVIDELVLIGGLQAALTDLLVETGRC